MNYSLISKSGQPAFGYVEIYKSDENCGKRTTAVVHYLPDGFNEHPNPRVFVSVLTELSESEITDGVFHDFFDSLSEIIKTQAYGYFNTPELLTYLDTITIHLSSIDGITEITHGDYGL